MSAARSDDQNKISEKAAGDPPATCRTVILSSTALSFGGCVRMARHVWMLEEKGKHFTWFILYVIRFIEICVKPITGFLKP